jgi:hypothetical protein
MSMEGGNFNKGCVYIPPGPARDKYWANVSEEELKEEEKWRSEDAPKLLLCYEDKLKEYVVNE